jgi:hypothetical protein
LTKTSDFCPAGSLCTVLFSVSCTGAYTWAVFAADSSGSASTITSPAASVGMTYVCAPFGDSCYQC